MSLTESVVSSVAIEQRVERTVARPGLAFACTWSLVAGLLCCLPHLMALRQLGADYTPFSVRPSVSSLVYDESHAYAPGPSKFQRNGSLAPEPDVYELRSVHGAQPVLHSLAIGALARFLGSLESAWMISDALFPALFFLLLYQISGLGSSCTPVRLAISWACFLVPFGPRSFLLLGSYSKVQPLEITRTPQPEISFPLLLLGCYLCARYLERRSWLGLIVAGAVIGLNCYSYYFYAVAVAGAFCILAGLTVLLGGLRLKHLSLMAASGAAAATPYAYWTYKAVRDGAQKELLSRMGVYTHAISASGLLLLAGSTLGLVLLWIRLRAQAGSDRSRPLLLFMILLVALLAGAGLGLNLQVLTGYDPQHEHFWNRLVQPVAALALGLGGAYLIEKYTRGGRWIRFAFAGGMLLLLGVAFFRQSRIAQYTEQDHRRSAPSVDVLEWVRSHLPADVVLGSVDYEMILLTPAVAGTWNFVPCGIRSMASDDEILKRYLIVSRIVGRGLPDIEQDLGPKNWAGVEAWRNSKPFVLIGRKSLDDALKTRIDALWNGLNLREELKSRRLDYVVAPVAADVCRASHFACPERVVYSNPVWKVVRVSGAGINAARGASLRGLQHDS